MDAGLDGVEPERRREAHDEHEDDEGVRTASSPKRRSAAGLEAVKAFRAVEDALDEPEHVGRAENHAQRGGDGPAAADLSEGAGENDELADEAARAWAGRSWREWR